MSAGVTSEGRFLVWLGVAVAVSVLWLVVGHPSASVASTLGAVIGLSGGLAAIAALRRWSARSTTSAARPPRAPNAPRPPR